MCPVDPVCHHLTCHRHLFSLSRTHNRRFIAMFTPINFAISVTPTSQCTLFTYLWYAWRESWRCANYSNSVYVAAFHEFLAICEMPMHSNSATHFRWWPPLVHHVPCCRLPQFSKTVELCYWVRLRVRFSITVMVTIRVRVSLSIYGYGFTLKLEGNCHRTFSWKIETRLLSSQHTSIN